MELLVFCWEIRAAFFGIIAYRYYKIKVDIQVFVNVVRGVMADIYAVYFHHLDSFWVYAVGFNARTINLRFIACKIT